MVNRRPGELEVIAGASFLLLALLGAATAALLMARYEAALAFVIAVAVAAALSAQPVRKTLRLAGVGVASWVRREWKFVLFLLLLSLPAVLTALVIGLLPPPPAYVGSLVSVPYEAEVRVDNTQQHLTERLSIDAEARRTLAVELERTVSDAYGYPHRLQVRPEDVVVDGLVEKGWQQGSYHDGQATYWREQHRALETPSLRMRTTVIRLSLPTLAAYRKPVRAHTEPSARAPAQARLLADAYPRGGSVVTVTAPKAMVVATFPVSATREDTLQGHLEQRTIDVGAGLFVSEEVRVMLAGRWLQSPAGERLYALAAWGPLPLVITIVAMTGATLVRKRWDTLAERILSIRLSRGRGARGEKAGAPARTPRQRRGRRRRRRGTGTRQRSGTDRGEHRGQV